jgi:hypothetical protein
MPIGSPGTRLDVSSEIHQRKSNAHDVRQDQGSRQPLGALFFAPNPSKHLSYGARLAGERRRGKH